MQSIAQVLKGAFNFVKMFRDWRKWKHEQAVDAAVKRLRAYATEILRTPNTYAVRSKTEWASLLSDPSLINEALAKTGYPLHGLGEGLRTQKEMWEVDVGQPYLVSRSGQPRR